MDISRERRREIIAALRKGTVPQRGLDFLAVGLGRFEPVIAEELADVAQGGAVFKAVRGDYGCGKTFFGRWVQEHAKKKGFATAEVQISETETPLHRLETVYRRAMEQLSTADCFLGAFRSVIDGWFYGLEEDVLAEGDHRPVRRRRRWPDGPTNCWSSGWSRSPVPRRSSPPPCGPTGRPSGRTTTPPPRGWPGGSPGSPTSPPRSSGSPGVKGDVDHFAALSFLRGLLLILKDSGYSGLVLVLDEIETLQRVRGDVREKGLNALRQLIDDIDGGPVPEPVPAHHRHPGLLRRAAGGPAAGAAGPAAARGLPDRRPLRQPPCRPASAGRRSTTTGWWRSGIKVRDLFVTDCSSPERVRRLADDELHRRRWPGPWRASSAARSASPRGCS